MLRDKRLNFLIIGVIWVISIVLPHFQANRSIPFLLISIFLFLILMSSMQIMASRYVPYAKWHLILLGIVFLLAVSLILLTLFKIEEPYLLFSRLGSYTMFLGSKLMVFGDLRHLTSVVDCSAEIEIGAVICDPWGRSFNQNPDIGYLFRFAHFSNPMVIGVLSTVGFFILILVLMRKIKQSFNMLYFIFLTPPVVLAIDRGNEIITISLILLAILYSSKPAWRYFALVFVSIASIFKFWPIVILIFWTLATSAFSRLEKIMICLISLTYLALHLVDLHKIALETQFGDLNGGSFGIRYLEFNSMFGRLSLLLIVVGTILLKRMMKPQEAALLDLLKSNPMLAALSIAYSALFITGAHFNYRLLLLIPIALLVWANSGSGLLPNFILALMITSRLNIVPIISAILAIYLTYTVAVSYIGDVRLRHYGRINR